ncbi:hypothetical protein D9V37_13335 [Nocardioides mangrovicus]|uniref:phospholipase D n=1 Tax=Nocardioides mangrovicus TaxID=2478913 RepID=A0A3L8NZU4_9ACTN|nr:phospholipase D-like domain-containing protein [Nocardioides mangrovicus]RLV48706.1 hypothetical protein D9V37_13335 [Nocardioides mangrovicus]
MLHKSWFLRALALCLMAGGLVAAEGSAGTAAPTATRVVRGYYTPPDGTKFNYPYSSSKQRNKIRNHVLRTVNATPTGGSIHIAAFSVNDQTLVNALIRAKRRGVAVQVIANKHTLTGNKKFAPSKSFRMLRKKLGHNVHRRGWSDERVSFAKVCDKSCRGKGGNVHYKMFLFSSAGGRHGTNKQWITMMGSPNLTTFAARGQWNHLTTASGDQARYDAYLNMFEQMKLDRSQGSNQYQDLTSINPETWFFPKPGTTAATDPLVRGLDQIRCTGLTQGYGRNGRTFIRIGAYTWYDTRGTWLAKKVRSLWNAGCDIAIEYSIMGNKAKKILYSPSGRGRIPMRQVGTYAKDGTILTYDHAKYVTVNGAVGDSNGASITWAGTTNFSNLGFYSDDFTQVWRNWATYRAFANDFYRVWRGPHARVPSPTSRVPANIEGRVGTGRYQNLEAS